MEQNGYLEKSVAKEKDGLTNDKIIKNDEKGKILVVDDMAMHLETARLYLEKSGFEVLCASDTKKAWTLVTEENPDLILLDVVMPGESGLDLLSKVQFQYPNTGVVIMTAYGSEDIAATALKLGATDYIRKPFKYSCLTNVVRKAMCKQREIQNQEIAVKSLKDAFEELQVSSDSILDCMSSGVVAVDAKFCIRMINQGAKRIFNVGNKAILGQNLYDAFPFLEQINLLKRTFDSNKGFQLYEVKIPNKEEYKIVNVNTDVIFDFHGHKIGAVAVFDDVTELRRKEQMLRESERLAIVGQMAAGVAHEIKNPLTAIKGFAQLLSGKTTEPIINTYTNIMLDEINRMNNVVQDFLQLARPKPPEFKKACINTVVEELTSVIEPQACLKKIDVDMDLDRSIPAGLMDPGQIKQVLLNLVQNAMEAMECGGKLGIKTIYIKECQEMRLDIRDTGCGIAAHKIKKLGVPFYTSKPNGTGLGLSISFSIIDQHKGRIEIQSREGHGTIFSIFLPIGD